MSGLTNKQRYHLIDNALSQYGSQRLAAIEMTSRQGEAFLCVRSSCPSNTKSKAARIKHFLKSEVAVPFIDEMLSKPTGATRAETFAINFSSLVQTSMASITEMASATCEVVPSLDEDTGRICPSHTTYNAVTSCCMAVSSEQYTPKIIPAQETMHYVRTGQATDAEREDMRELLQQDMKTNQSNSNYRKNNAAIKEMLDHMDKQNNRYDRELRSLSAKLHDCVGAKILMQGINTDCKSIYEHLIDYALAYLRKFIATRLLSYQSLDDKVEAAKRPWLSWSTLTSAARQSKDSVVHLLLYALSSPATVLAMTQVMLKAKDIICYEINLATHNFRLQTYDDFQDSRVADNKNLVGQVFAQLSGIILRLNFVEKAVSAIGDTFLLLPYVGAVMSGLWKMAAIWTVEGLRTYLAHFMMSTTVSNIVSVFTTGCGTIDVEDITSGAQVGTDAGSTTFFGLVNAVDPDTDPATGKPRNPAFIRQLQDSRDYTWMSSTLSEHAKDLSQKNIPSDIKHDPVRLRVWEQLRAKAINDHKQAVRKNIHEMSSQSGRRRRL
jgi:hypothetical protein